MRESERPIVVKNFRNGKGAKGPYWKHDSDETKREPLEPIRFPYGRAGFAGDPLCSENESGLQAEQDDSVHACNRELPGEPDVGNLQVRFEEGGMRREAELLRSQSLLLIPLLYRLFAVLRTVTFSQDRRQI